MTSMVPASPLMVPVMVPWNFGSVVLMTPAPLARITPFSRGGTSRLVRSSCTVFAVSKAVFAAASCSVGLCCGASGLSPPHPESTTTRPTARGAPRASRAEGRRMAATVTAIPSPTPAGQDRPIGQRCPGSRSTYWSILTRGARSAQEESGLAEVDGDRVAVAHLAGQQRPGQPVADLALHEPAQRAGTV